MSVVFTDNYTVSSNTNIDAYPTGSPDYSYNRGSGTDILVNAANDRVQINAANASKNARIIDAAVPTGDQQITAQCGSQSYNVGWVSVRNGTSQQYYNSYLDLSVANEVQIWRRDNSTTSTLLVSADRSLSGAGGYTHRLKVTGSGATVNLELQINATAVVTFADTNANRITSGPPGVGGYDETGNNVDVYVDDVSVDDLSSGAYSLGASGGSYALTGTAADLELGRVISVGAGSYNLSGSGATLSHGYRVDAALGNYDITGSAVGTLYGRSLQADPGSYLSDGMLSDTLWDRILAAASGTYNLTGSDASLISSFEGAYVLAAEGGSYVLSGSDVAILLGRLLSAAGGVYGLTGTDAGLVHGTSGAYVLTAEGGSYILSGADVGLLLSRLLTVAPGAYDFSGSDAVLQTARRLIVESGGYVISGVPVTPVWSGAPELDAVFVPTFRPRRR